MEIHEMLALSNAHHGQNHGDIKNREWDIEFRDVANAVGFMEKVNGYGFKADFRDGIKSYYQRCTVTVKRIPAALDMDELRELVGLLNDYLVVSGGWDYQGDFGSSDRMDDLLDRFQNAL